MNTTSLPTPSSTSRACCKTPGTLKTRMPNKNAECDILSYSRMDSSLQRFHFKIRFIVPSSSPTKSDSNTDTNRHRHRFSSSITTNLTIGSDNRFWQLVPTIKTSVLTPSPANTDKISPRILTSAYEKEIPIKSNRERAEQAHCLFMRFILLTTLFRLLASVDSDNQFWQLNPTTDSDNNRHTPFNQPAILNENTLLYFVHWQYWHKPTTTPTPTPLKDQPYCLHKVHKQPYSAQKVKVMYSLDFKTLIFNKSVHVRRLCPSHTFFLSFMSHDVTSSSLWWMLMDA